MSAIQGFARSSPRVGLERPYYDVHGVTHHGPLRATILADDVLQGSAHYVAELRRHVPCPGHELCHLCQSRRGKRRKGYVSAITTGSRIPFVLELTDNALSALEEAYKSRGSLRGLRVRLERQPTKAGIRTKNGRVIVHIEGDSESEALPKSFDEAPHLQKMWGLLPDEQRDDQPTQPQAIDDQADEFGEIPNE